MQRFYCTICRKIKRVQKLPISVLNPHAEQPEERVGRCMKHGEMAQGKTGQMLRYAEAHDIPVVQLNMLRRKVAK